jgi:diguanylate cyclase (GGDEF)-like protein
MPRHRPTRSFSPRGGRGLPEKNGRARDLATRTLAYLYVAGATLGLLTLALPHSGGMDEAGIVGVAAGAYAVAVLVMLAGALSLAMLQLLVVFGSALITAALGLSGEPSSGYAFFYLWVTIYAAYFFSRGELVAQVAIIGIGYAAALLAWGGGSARLTSWVLTVGSLIVAAAVVRILKESLDQMVVRLSRAAETDPLTALLNRRGFNDCLASELERARRADRPLGVLVGDLDHFKRVNDRLGHAAGDGALERIADLLAHTKRGSDRVARIGGEEFALILPYTSREGTVKLAERLRWRVRESFEKEDVALTFSFGIAVFPEDGDDVESLLRTADHALYAAKELGRDRSVDAVELQRVAARGQITALTVLPGGQAGDRPTG